jgi:hypothetical protein
VEGEEGIAGQERKRRCRKIWRINRSRGRTGKIIGMWGKIRKLRKKESLSRWAG